MKLFLDDVRKPPNSSWQVVRSYDAFISWMESNPTPDIISFDHDLAFEHYPFHDPNPEQSNGSDIAYGNYREKTGYHCAQWCVEHGRLPHVAIVHSLNPVGANNIFELLKTHCSAIKIPMVFP
jgi:hypothetical protein